MKRPPAIAFSVRARWAICIGCWFWIGSTADPTSSVSTSRIATASAVVRSPSKGICAIHTLRKPSSRACASAPTKESIGDPPMALTTFRLIRMQSIEARACNDVQP
jgi:hypothetical protein